MSLAHQIHMNGLMSHGAMEILFLLLTIQVLPPHAQEAAMDMVRIQLMAELLSHDYVPIHSQPVMVLITVIRWSYITRSSQNGMPYFLVRDAEDRA